MNLKKLFHFSILVMKLENEKFSKFVLFLNQKTNYTFGTRIEGRIENKDVIEIDITEEKRENNFL